MPLFLTLRRWVLALAARLPTSVGARARFLRAREVLVLGTIPEGLTGLAEEMLSRADRAHRRGRRQEVVDWADKALQLLFHSTVHYGPSLSPLSDRDLDLFRPLRGSEVGRLLTTVPDPERPVREGGHRVLVLAGSSWTFVDRVVDALDGQEGFEFRCRSLAELPRPVRPSRRGAIEARYLWSAHGIRQPAPDELHEDLAWADVIWMEWATYTAAWLTLLDGIDARIVVRLHRYEAYTPFPQLMDMAQVDELVCVAPHLRNLVTASTPRLGQAKRVRVLPNVNDLSRYVAEKEPGAERTLIQIGWSLPVKSPHFVLDLLERLRAQDMTWRLLLVGRIPDESTTWGRELRDRVSAMGDAIEVLGFRSDMPRVLRRAGIVVSSSRNEGTHESIAEAAAAGCVPIVRDWPENAPWGGASTVYPAHWVVDGLDEAIHRILGMTDGRYELSRLAARRWALESTDPDKMLREYAGLLRGDEIATHD